MKLLIHLIFLIFLIINVMVVKADEDSSDPNMIPAANLTHDEQVEKLKEMSDALNHKLEPTAAPLIPAQNLTQEEKVEQLKEMSDGSFFSRELNKKLGETTEEAIQAPESANITQEENSKILSEEITRRLDTEPH